MEELVKLLEELYAGTDNSYIGKNEEEYFSRKVSKVPNYDEIDVLACDLLIDKYGGCNWDNIFWLEEHGYKVFAGESDSFGWLTGCIQKKDDNRIFVYG